MTELSPCVFLDRDGTMNEDVGYLDRLERLVLYPACIDAVRLLNRAGFLVAVVTNQAGRRAGVATAEDFVKEAPRPHRRAVPARDARRIDGFYYCPHLPTAAVAAYRRECDCRKPQPGLRPAGRARARRRISRARLLWATGGGDVEMGSHGRRAHGRSCRTGYGTDRRGASARQGSAADAGCRSPSCRPRCWILVPRRHREQEGTSEASEADDGRPISSTRGSRVPRETVGRAERSCSPTAASTCSTWATPGTSRAPERTATRSWWRSTTTPWWCGSEGRRTAHPARGTTARSWSRRSASLTTS